MASIAAAGLACIALALLLMTLQGRRGWAIAAAVLAVPFALGFFASLGHVYHVRALYTIGHPTAVAFPAALLMMLLAAQVPFLRPLVGVLEPIVSRQPVGRIARSFLPMAFCLPVVVGWVRIAGERQGLFSSEVGVVAVQTLVGLVCA